MPQKITIELEFEDEVEPLCFTEGGKINTERISALFSDVCTVAPPEVESGENIPFTKGQLGGDEDLSLFEFLLDYEPVKAAATMLSCVHCMTDNNDCNKICQE